MIKFGDKVVMWYVFGNWDDEVIFDFYFFKIDWENVWCYFLFGFGIYCCMGNWVGEFQLRIFWEEIMKCFYIVEVVGDLVCVWFNFVFGFSELLVWFKVW